MVFRSLQRQLGKRALVALTIALGISLATAVLSVLWDVGDKLNAELKAYGANIVVRPKADAALESVYGEAAGATPGLAEDQLGQIKTIFWAYNIVDFAPFLSGEVLLGDRPVTLLGTWFAKELDLPTGEQVTTGVRALRSWWDLKGEWIGDQSAGAMVGRQLAEDAGITVGDTITLGGKQLPVEAVFDSGEDADSAVVVPLALAQEMLGLPGKVSWVEVSALTTPDNELSERAARDPKSLSATDWETWYCTAYVSSIAYQIEEVLPDSVARAVRQVAAAEGTILDKTSTLMLLVAIIAMIGAALGIANLISAMVGERAAEIGLRKAIGASNLAVSVLLLAELAIVGMIGAAVGFAGGLGLAQVIGQAAFGAPIAFTPMVVPVVAAMALVVILVGSVPALRLLTRLRPAEVLHGR
jgi:putative ABC transport system permease protein